MTLIDGWKSVWAKLWSVRLALAASALSAVEVGYNVWLTGKPPLLAVIACLVSLAAAVARIVAQPALHE